MSTETIEIDGWDLNGIVFRPSVRELCVQGRVHRLAPKPAAVLEALMEAAPEPVSKEELLDRIWPRQVVPDSVVSDAVKAVRRVCRSGSDSLIETLHRHGYRLTVVPVPAPAADPRIPTPPGRWRPILSWAVPAIALTVGAWVVAGVAPPQGQSASPPARVAPVSTPRLSSADGLYTRGLELYARYRADDNARAIELFERALEHDPDHARSWAARANAEAMLAFKFGGGMDAIQRSERFARQAIALAPGDASGHRALAAALSYQGRLEEAAQANRQALAIYDRYVAAMVNLGTIRTAQGRLVDGIRLLERAIERAPSAVIARMQLGHAYRALGLNDLARAWYDSGLAMAPGSVVDATADFPALLGARDFDTLDLRLSRLIAENGEDPNLSYWAGLRALYVGEFQEADRLFQRGAAMTAPSGTLWLDLMLRAQSSRARAGMPVASAEVLALEHRVQQRLKGGSEAYADQLRMALAASALGDATAVARHLEQAVDSGWMAPDALAFDPAWDLLSSDGKTRLAEQIEQRREAMLAILSSGAAPIAAN